MPAYWSGPTPRSLGQRWRAAGDDLKRQARQEVIKRAREVMELSKAQAPMDLGNLEAAHRLDVRQSNSNQISINIAVGGFRGGVNVSDYAMEMHEGSYNLGPRSVAKAAANGKFVGRKYLERALEEKEGSIIQALENLLGGFG